MLDDFILIALCICVGCFILAMFWKQVLDKVFINYLLKSPANRDWENSSGAFSIGGLVAGTLADTPVYRGFNPSLHLDYFRVLGGAN